MKTRPAVAEGRSGTPRTMVLSATFSIAVLAVALMTPSVAFAQARSSGHTSSQEYTSSSETETSEEYTSSSETETSEEYTSSSETETTDESTSSSETETTDESTSSSETETTDESTSSSETETTEETTPSSETETTPAEIAVFDPGPCVGAFVTASGSGFQPSEPINVQRDGATIVIVAAGADGSFAVRVDIAGVQDGVHTITATGTLSAFSATGEFDVEPQICTSGSGTVTSGSLVAVVVVAGSSTPLATTGFPAASAVAAAVLALLVGTMLLVATRHRRSVRASFGPSNTDGPRHL